MNMIADPANEKLVEEVKQTVKSVAHAAAVEGVKEAKEDLAKEEAEKK